MNSSRQTVGRRVLVAIGAVLMVLSATTVIAPASGATSPELVAATSPAGRSLATGLLPDGTVRPTSTPVSYDATGFHLVRSATGAPEFIADQAGARSAADANWDDRFASRGTFGNEVTAVAVSGSDVYVGGYFTQAAGQLAGTFNNVAHWDGREWFPMGTGTNGTVNGIAVSGSDVYVVGDFTTAGTAAANHVAHWNGTQWSAMGTGLADTLPYGSADLAGRAIAIYGGKVVVTGTFNTAGGTTANSVAAWDGSSWSALGTGIQQCVGCTAQTPGDGYALAVYGSQLVIGGNFQVAGSVSTNGLAAWTGTTWSSLGGGLSLDPNTGQYGRVNALAVNGSDLYAGGTFTSVGGVTDSPSLGRWNGSAWSAVGGGGGVTHFGQAGTVSTLAYSGGALYIGGTFETAGTVAATHLAKATATAFSTVGANNLSDDVVALAADPSGGVQVGGPATVDALDAEGIAHWTGTAWNVLGDGTSLFGKAGGTISAVAVADDGSIYAGGSMAQAGSATVTSLARWSGSGWQDVGGGVTSSGQSGYVYAVVVSGTDVYVGGSFDTAGGVGASNIAKWDGQHWSALGSGTNGDVTALAVNGGYLYAGGSFSAAGTATVSNIARYNLASHAWSSLGTLTLNNEGPTSNGQVNAIAFSGNEVILGGPIRDVGSQHLVVDGLVAWDSTTSPGSGEYVGWSNPGHGVLNNNGSGDFPGSVSALVVDGSTLYVGGTFLKAGDGVAPVNSVIANSVARLSLSTNQWSSLGSGLEVSGNSQPTAAALSLVGSDLYVGGTFSTAGGVTANSTAKWSTTGSTWTSLGTGITDPGCATVLCSGVGNVLALSAGSGQLAVGGTFSAAGGLPDENFSIDTIPVPPSPPAAPTGVMATAGNGQAVVRWTAPVSPAVLTAAPAGSTPPVTAYAVTPIANGVAQTPVVFNSTATTETVPGLVNGTAYKFTVAAINSVGTGPQSAASNVVTPVTVPSAPTGVSGTPGNGKVTLGWAAPANGGSPITSYVVTTYKAGVSQGTVGVAAPSTSTTLSGLANGTAYTFKVAAVSTVGTGPQSAASAPVTPSGPTNTADQSFVIAAYSDFLNRAPTASELSVTAGALDGGTTSRSAVVTGLATSPEWVSAIVNKLYVDTLGRVGDPGGVAYWSHQISSGAMSVATVAANFYASPEYYDGFGGGTDSVWITDLYHKVLLRNPDPGGLNYWVGQVAATNRVSVGIRFYQSAESAHTRVKALFESLLKREPDQGGWDYWAGRVVADGDIALAENLASSPEYFTTARTRFP